MILDTLNLEDGKQILNLMVDFHKESRYKDTPINLVKLGAVLDQTVANPDKFYIAYSKDTEGVVNGYFIGHITSEFYSDTTTAHDLLMYVIPAKRGSTVFYSLLKKFEQWAKSKKANRILLSHATGINTERSSQIFPKMGYEYFGNMFDKEI